MIRKVENVVLTVAPPLAGLVVLISLWAIFAWVPTDKGLGLSQRIFYYHVPSATSCFLAFIGAGVASIAFLKTRNPQWDHAAHAAVGVGMIFATIVLVTGSIWARTAWGTWWTWDARLTTFLILWILFAVYLMLRTFARDNDMMPNYAGVLAIVGALNIPLVMLATKLWRTIHPQVINNPDGGLEDPRMVTTLLLSMAAVLLVFLWLWALRMRVLRLTERTELLVGQFQPGGSGL